MTDIERQILINQVVIMSVLTHIIKDSSFGNKQDIEDIGKCVKLTSDIINSCEHKR